MAKKGKYWLQGLLNLHRKFNKTKIPTYGTRVRQVKLGRKSYSHVFILADIEVPIMGWDFIKRFKLDISWSQWGDPIILDRVAGISSVLKEGQIMNHLD